MLQQTQTPKPMSAARSTNKNLKCDSPEAKRMVIVDDHPLFRKGLQELIHSDGSFAVCGEAGNASEAMEVIRKLHPDLVIVDLSLPGANGIELIKNIRAEFAKLPILVLSMHDESLYALRAMRAGADGYVMKRCKMSFRQSTKCLTGVRISARQWRRRSSRNLRIARPKAKWTPSRD